MPGRRQEVGKECEPATERYCQRIPHPGDSPRPHSIWRVATAGTVYLVGAGPGDPGLVTRRALQLVREADAIVYDRLIPAGLVAEARADADLRYAGKEPGKPSMEQEAINA